MLLYSAIYIRHAVYVIFVEFKEGPIRGDKGREEGVEDIDQLGAIIFTGIAYLNNNDNAMMRLYRLLTGQRHEPVTVEALKKNPGLLIFIFEPVAIHNYDELKCLNDLMEKSILSAA